MSSIHVTPAATYSRTARSVRTMFARIASRYDLANSVLSLGIHHLWRARALRVLVAIRKNLSSSPLPALDLCTGTGVFLPALKRAFGEVVGIDFCLPMMQQNKRLCEGISLLQGDAEKIPLRDGSFAVATVVFGIRNVEHVETALSELYRVLISGGHLAIVEFGKPNSAVIRALFWFYSSTVLPLLGGLISGDWEAYRYLQRTSWQFPSGEQFCAILRQNGFEIEHWSALSGGIAYLYVARKGVDK